VITLKYLIDIFKIRAIHPYIYIYIERERERERELSIEHVSRE